METSKEQFTKSINWPTLAYIQDQQQFFATWLSYLAQSIGQVSEAVLIWRAHEQTYQPVAFWPEQGACSDALAAACEQVIQLNAGLARQGEFTAIAQPLRFDDRLQGVVAIRFSCLQLPSSAASTLMQSLGWLSLCLPNDGEQAVFRERLLTTLDLLVTGLNEQDGDSAVQSVATELAVKLGCDRVSIGFGNQRQWLSIAVSHNADFNRHLELGQSLEAAMTEVGDQGQAIHYVRHDESRTADQISLQHQLLAERYGNETLLSVPVYFDEENLAVFLYEWPQTVDDPLIEQLAYGLPPVLARVLQDKRRADRGLLKKLSDALRDAIRHLTGSRYVKLKLLTGLTLAACLFGWLATGDFRISAEARLEGKVRQIVASPFDGFVSESNVRAGQLIRKGEALALLDDRDMRLESSRWASQQAQYLKQSHDAEAQHNLAQWQIARAQAQQAEAQRALSEAMAGRATVQAPIDGIITLGDLSQQLGSAVKKGQTLFEIAALDSYRIVLEVDEHDIAFLLEGQHGELLLTALPGQTFAYTIRMITPVAEAKEGRNYFRVEASLDQVVDRLRPGMEGIAKTWVAQERLVWIWTRPLLDWLRLQSWYWLGL